MPRKSAASLAVVAPVVPSTARHPEPPTGLPEPAAALWRSVVRTRPPEYFDGANRELLEIFVRAVVEHRRVADALERLDVVADIDLYAKLVRAADTHAKRAAQAATRLRLAKNSTTDSRAAARAVGDHRSPIERMRARYTED